MITDRTVIYSLIEKALETDRERSGGGQSDISSSMAATGKNVKIFSLRYLSKSRRVFRKVEKVTL